MGPGIPGCQKLSLTRAAALGQKGAAWTMASGMGAAVGHVEAGVVDGPPGAEVVFIP